MGIRKIDPRLCTGCNICGMICPEFAIDVVPTKERPKEKRR